MKCKHEELPIECQNCVNLHCGHVYMNGEGSYHCSKVICFWKYKEDKCKEYVAEQSEQIAKGEI